MSLAFTAAVLQMEEICCCCSTLHISSPCSDCSDGLFSPHSGKYSCDIFLNVEINLYEKQKPLEFIVKFSCVLWNFLWNSNDNCNI
jgi:hypothetical protein